MGIFRRLAMLAAGAALATGSAAATLDEVRERGVLRCGVSEGLQGFSMPGEGGVWHGLDVDLCRAVAAAVLSDPEKVSYVPLSAAARFEALTAGKVDLLARNTTWTLSRDAGMPINFAAVSYYDGQGFLVRAAVKAKGARDLGGRKLCLTRGTTTELNAADFFDSNRLKYKPVAFDNAEAAVKAYEAGRCDAFTADHSALAAWRLRLSKPDGHRLLPDVISREPLGPAVRHGDDQWLDIVRWTLFAMVEAEELGIHSMNVGQLKASAKPAIRRLLSGDGGMGKKLGLDDGWSFRIISMVGNYEEVFQRNLGTGSPLGLPRGLNALWRDGGLMYPIPVR